MKPKHPTTWLPFLCSALTVAQATPVTRSGTADNLNAVGAWNGGVAPTTANVATWDAVSSLSNTLGANLTWGGLDLTAASGAVAISGANSLTLDHATDANTVFSTGANDFSWTSTGTTTGTNTFNIIGALSTVAPGNGNTGTGATFSGSGTVTLASTGTKNWSTSGNATSGQNGVTRVDFTGTLALRGATIPAVGVLAANWLALGGGGGTASNVGTTVQTGSFALDTGDATSCGSFILTQGFSGQALKLNRLSGTGSIRCDWGLSAGTQTRGIELDQATDTTLAGSILVHNGSSQRRNLQFTKKGVGTLTLTGALGSSATAGGAVASLNFDLQGGAIQIGDGTTNLAYQNAANWDAASTFVVGAGTTLRFKTAGPFTWSRALTGGTGTVELTTDGDPSDGTIAFTANSSGFGGNILLEAGSLRMGPNLGSGTLRVKTGTFIAAGLAATNATSTVGGLELADATESDFRLGGTNDRINVTGADGLKLPGAGGTHTINLYGTPSKGGTFTLVDYSGTPLSEAEFGRLALGMLPGGTANFQLVHNTANTSIDLVITLEDQIWKGGTDGNWDSTTANWALKGTPTTAVPFSFDNPAVFDDSASAFAITVDALGVAPLSVTFDHSSHDYSLGGGSITGGTGLIKKGTGTLTLAQNNAFTGGTIVEAGLLVLDGSGNDSSGGTKVLAGKVQVGSGGTTGSIGGGEVSLAAGTALEFHRSNAVAGTPDLDYKLTPRMRNVSGAGDITLTGGVHLFNYTGAGLGFAETGSWNNFSGNLTIKGGSEFMTIRNGATAMGSGDVILGDATTSGALSQIEGNWTWTNDLVLVGSDNRIRNRSLNAPRALKLQGVLSGSGGLTFEDLAVPAAMTDPNRGFILTNTNTLTGTLTIAAGVPVRVGGIPGNIDASNPGLLADNAGTLGAATVVNQGTLTFSRKDAHTVANAISGSGNLRVGIPAAATLGDTTTQVLTYAGTCDLTGTTTVNNGSLLLATGASLASSQATVVAGATLGGSGTLTAALACAGTLAPGTGGIGTFTVTGNTAVTGTLAIEADATADKLVVTGDLDLTGSTVTLTESGAGLPANGAVIAEWTGSLTGLPTAPAGFVVRAQGNTLLLSKAEGYDAWKTANAGGQAANLDFDLDGVPNGVEYFMGETGSGLTANPAVTANGATRTVVWKRDPAATVASFAVQTSSDLATWTPIASGDPALDLSDPTQVKLTLPANSTRTFCRLSVTP